MGTVHAKEATPPPCSQKDPKSEKNFNIHSEPDPCGPTQGGKNINFGGVEARVDKIHVEGLDRTKDDIVIDSVKDLFDASDFDELMTLVHRVREKLGNLGCFKNIGVEIDTSTGAESTANGVEVTFYVKELQKFSGGVNTCVGNNEGSLVVTARAPNIFGRGERLEAEYSHGSRSTNNLSLSYLKPLRSKYDASIGTSIFQHSSDWPYSGYRCVERGFLFDWSFFSTCMVKHNLQYEGTWREMGTISKTSAMSVREENGHTLKSALRHILTVDKRDELIFPTTGSLFRFTTEFAGLGGDVKFLKNDFYWQYNFPVSDGIVIQATCQAGVLGSPFMDEMSGGLPDKFYNGGPLSVKGFQTRGIGPRSDGNAIGANLMWGAGLHLFTPLPFRAGKGGFGDLFRIHCFVTSGQCKEVDFNGESDRAKELFEGYRLSAGAGLALRLGQMAQVELNYVFPLVYSDDDVLHPGLQFGIGLQFL